MTRLALVVMAALVWAAIAGTVGAEEIAPPAEPWSPEQGARILRRLDEREPFLASREALLHADSLNRFFDEHDYRALRGNPVFGYWDEGHFRWTGVRVAWDGIEPVARSAKPITRRAWTAAFAYVAKKHGLTIDRNAPIRVRGACVGAVIAPNVAEPNRGVVLELRIDSPTGRFLYRFGMGKPTIEDAIGASLDWAVSFARTLNREPGAGGGAQ